MTRSGYEWNFGDGTMGEGVSVQHEYTVKGVYHAVLTVSDRAIGGLTNSSMPLAISVGNYAPVPTILTPLSTDTYKAGQTISFTGTGTDVEDGDLPASAFHWSFLFGHNTHFHNFIGPVDGTTSGSFNIPLTGETDPNQYYRVFSDGDRFRGPQYDDARRCQAGPHNLQARQQYRRASTPDRRLAADGRQ